MMVKPPDVETWATEYLRGELAGLGRDAEVDVRQPDDAAFPLSRPLVVIRVDAGGKITPVTFDCQLGVSVLAGSRQDDSLARALANDVFAILSDREVIFAPNSPVVSIDDGGCMFPEAVDDELDVSRRYMTISWDVVGTF